MHNINNIDKMEQARNREVFPFGIDTLSGQFNSIDVDSNGLQATRSYVWDAVALAWIAATGSSTGGSVTQSVAYTVRLDEVSASLMYVGNAAAGSLTNNPVWQIKRVTGNAVEWALGNTSFDKVWDNRASLVYS